MADRIFSLHRNRDLSVHLAGLLNTPEGGLDTRHFPDGDIDIAPLLAEGVSAMESRI